MNEQDMKELITDSILHLDQLYDISSFEEAMVLTDNEGLVIRMNDGSKFYVTIKQTREAN